MRIEEIIQKAERDPRAFIAACEADHHARVDALAQAVAKTAGERPFVLLSGPSGSGKTTTAHMLEQRLDGMGLETHIISLDNYFRSFTEEEKVLFERHQLDLESPDRVDGELLSEQIRAMINGKSVEIPRYDFTTNARCEVGVPLHLRHGEIVIFEGIHALNPSLLESADEFTARIYVSVRTRIEHDNGQLLHPSKIRLARRMIRDQRERGRSLSAVVEIYDSVERGENLYIMPYKHRADFDMDTFIPYELCAYKNALPASLPKEEAAHPWLTELFDVLNRLPAINTDLVPENALIREFIGT